MLLSKIQWQRKYEGICLVRGAPLCIRSRVRSMSSQAALLMGVSGGLQALCGCWESASRLSLGSALGSNGSASGAPGLARMEQGSNFSYNFTSKAGGLTPSICICLFIYQSYPCITCTNLLCTLENKYTI